MISNYINHHQVPFCNAMYGKTQMMQEEAAEFFFIQTQPMDSERAGMGWQSEYDLPYLRKYYEDEQACHELLLCAEIVIFGGTERKELLRERLENCNDKQVTFVYSERLYREGQWKFISPRGLIDKYHLYVKHRRKRAYLMCAGAFVASDFALIHAFPKKKFKWGYFPGLRTLDIDKLIEEKEKRIRETKQLELLWAGRFMPLKHPEYAIWLVRDINARGIGEEGLRVHLTMVGGGELEEKLRAMVCEYGIEDAVTFSGFLSPEQVREKMLTADVHLFTSNHLEGWGAVVNEAMNSGCVVISSHMAGATGSLIRHKENGLVFRSEDYDSLKKTLVGNVGSEEQRTKLRKNAYDTITKLWNENIAAERFLRLAVNIYNGEGLCFEAEGPLSEAVAIRPSKMYNHLVSKADRT